MRLIERAQEPRQVVERDFAAFTMKQYVQTDLEVHAR
jgi:hypothetical protein